MTQEEIDRMYMRRCLQLATNGLGRARPNPLVGCVIVKDGKIISEGYHQEYGHNHAERNALLRQGDYRGATLYVNLEPCSHYGKTPPCADHIIEKGIKRVVCCNDDPNPLVAGNGFRKLEEAGIEVVRHVLEEEGRELNRRFFTFMEKKRPYVILKWAESADGFMAPSLGSHQDIKTSRHQVGASNRSLEVSKSRGLYIYNVGTGNGYSVLDMVKAFVRVNGVDVPYSIKPRRAGDIATCYCDPSKAKVELGWEAKYGIDDMVRDSWNWQHQNPDGYPDGEN